MNSAQFESHLPCVTGPGCGECDAAAIAAIERAPERDPEARKALASLRLSIAMCTEQIDTSVDEIDAALAKAFCDDRIYPALRRILEMADVLREAAEAK